MTDAPQPQGPRPIYGNSPTARSLPAFIARVHEFFSDPGRVVTGLICLAVFQYIIYADGSLLWLPSVFVVFAVLVSVVWLRRKPADRLLILALVLGLAISVYTLLLAYLTRSAYLGALNTPLGIATCWVFIVAVNTRHRIVAVMVSIVVATSVSAVFGLLMFLWADELGWSGRRVAGLNWHPAAFGLFLAVTLPVLAGAMLLTASRKARGLLGLLALILLTALVLSYTRAAWVASLAGSLLIAPLLRINRSLIMFVGLLLLLTVPSVVMFEYVRMVRYDLGDFMLLRKSDRLTLADSSFKERMLMLEIALHDGLERPFGRLDYQATYQATASTDFRDPHNQFLDVLVKLGWPGLALSLAFYAVLLRMSWTSFKTARSHAGRVLMLTATGSFVAYSTVSMAHIWDPFTGDAFGWLIIGLVFGVHVWIRTESGLFMDNERRKSIDNL